MRYFGLFWIEERIGEVAYPLQLPESTRIHPVFHISVLKKCVGEPTQQIIPSALIADDSGPILQPAIIIAFWEMYKKGKRQPQLLIQWQFLLKEDAIWEEFELFKQLYPDFDLEDKVNFKGGDYDMVMKKLRAKNVDTSDVHMAANPEVVLTNKPKARTLRRSLRTRKEPRWLRDTIHKAPNDMNGVM